MIQKFMTHPWSILLSNLMRGVMGALAAEGGLEKSSFKFRSKHTDGFRLSNGIWKAIPDLWASGAEATGRDDRFGAWHI